MEEYEEDTAGVDARPQCLGWLTGPHCQLTCCQSHLHFCQVAEEEEGIQRIWQKWIRLLWTPLMKPVAILSFNEGWQWQWQWMNQER